jgi:hypothetical protein
MIKLLNNETQHKENYSAIIFLHKNSFKTKLYLLVIIAIAILYIINDLRVTICGVCKLSGLESQFSLFSI